VGYSLQLPLKDNFGILGGTNDHQSLPIPLLVALTALLGAAQTNNIPAKSIVDFLAVASLLKALSCFYLLYLAF
jgi:hypothetical protein